jgi:hypothetical protein
MESKETSGIYMYRRASRRVEGRTGRGGWVGGGAKVNLIAVIKFDCRRGPTAGARSRRSKMPRHQTTAIECDSTC